MDSVDPEFLKEARSFLTNPVWIELVNLVNFRLPGKDCLPEDYRRIFERSCELYNSKAPSSSYEMVRARKANNNAAGLYDPLHTGVQNAWAGLYYNLEAFGSLSDLACKMGEKLASSCTSIRKPTTLGFVPQRLILEYEHLTLRSRIVLDRLNYFLSYFFETDARNLYKLARHLRANRTGDAIATKVENAINKNRHLLDLYISSDKSKRRTERDTLAHQVEI